MLLPTSSTGIQHASPDTWPSPGIWPNGSVPGQQKRKAYQLGAAEPKTTGLHLAITVPRRLFGEAFKWPDLLCCEALQPYR